MSNKRRKIAPVNERESPLDLLELSPFTPSELFEEDVLKLLMEKHGFEEEEIDNAYLDEGLMRKQLNVLGLKDLNDLLKHHFPEYNCQGGKYHVVEEAISKIYGRNSPQEKRKMEKENIEDASQNVELNFINLCNITCPREINIQILSFCKYSRNLLFRVGKTCKMIY